MQKVTLIALFLTSFLGFSQEHFAGISTSSRVGILNADVNPAELVNMKHKFEANIFGLSANVNNNKIGFKDIISGTDLKKTLFKDSGPVNFNLKAVVLGPSYAMKIKKFAVGISTKLNVNFDIIDLDAKIGEAISNGSIYSAGNVVNINNNTNQRISGTTWGEVNLHGAMNLLDSDKNKFNVGVTLKLLFPGSFANAGAQNYIGQINTTGTSSTLSNTTAALNFAYSGKLANSFTNFNDYKSALFGGLNGFATDLGVNYQLKDGDDKYKLNIGMAVKNIGSMTFKDDNNASTSYNLNIGSGLNALQLIDFNNVNSVQGAENVLLTKGFLNKLVADKQDFVVQLPTQFSIYADVKVVSKFFVSGFLQQRLKDNNKNDQITAQNLYTIIPRVVFNYFEFYVPITSNEISGTAAGFGFRIGGFYLGSNSAVTAVINDSKQADFYTGFRWNFL